MKFIKTFVADRDCPLASLRIQEDGIHCFGWGEAKDEAFVREQIKIHQENVEQELLIVRYLEESIKVYKKEFNQ